MKVIVHVGPSKTGTSAIQNWLVSHCDELARVGIHYPIHNVDSNGVSSGNLLRLFDRRGDVLTLNKDKLDEILSEANINNCKVLLLSSEFFAELISPLVDAFKKIHVIAYVRYPLEFTESSYNQAIKRHRETKQFGIRMQPQAFNLERLEKICSKLEGQSYQIRPYHKDCFEGGNLITDFCHALNIHTDSNLIAIAKTTQSLVNTSYSLENLEVKRWFNQFDLEEQEKNLDTFLQSQSNGSHKYSLVRPELFKLVKVHFNTLLKAFSEKHDIYNADKFLSVCEQLEHRTFRVQDIEKDAFCAVVKQFLTDGRSDVDRLFDLYQREWRHRSDIENQHLLMLLKTLFPVKVRLLWYWKRERARVVSKARRFLTLR